MKKPILKAKGISKTFSGETILKGINLEVRRGETVAIMGPSGVGKTTLLHILGTLEKPESGSLEISGKNGLSGGVSQIRNEHIGFIFQNFNLLEESTSIENVLMPARIGRKPLDSAHALELLKLVNLENKAKSIVKHLSGGEKQRVAIARALCNNPDLILADEPSGNLDDTNSAAIHQLLIHTAKELGKSLVVVTHNRELAAECDQTYLIHDGNLTSPHHSD